LPRGVDSTQAGGALRRRRFSWFLAAGAAVLAAAGLLWWRASSQRPHYVTAAVTRGNVRRSVNTTGALNPVVTVQVGSYVSGPVKTLKCDFNTEVVVGQLCAQIDPVPFQLIVDQDRAEVGTAEAQLKKDQAALVYAKIAFERDSKLLAEGTVSQDTVDNDRSVRDQVAAQIVIELTYPSGGRVRDEELHLWRFNGDHKIAALRARPAVAITIDTAGPPPEVLLIRGQAVVTDVDGIVAEYALAHHRYYGPEQGARNVAQADHPGTRMARIAVRPAWAGVLDFATRFPGAMAGRSGR